METLLERLTDRALLGLFEALSDDSGTRILAFMFDSTVVRAHISAAGAKRGKKPRRLGAHAEASRQKFIFERTFARFRISRLRSAL